MKKVLVAFLIVAVTMMALAIPAFADEGGDPNGGASLGKWRHTQAPGQEDGWAPGELGAALSGRATGEGGQALSEHVHQYTPNDHTEPFPGP